ncbi:hypothetical protein L210DRAFT_3487780 [Boletus edulis BED1]|uniref:Sacsin/Nov domain-containing protein n=1 Tax=Boletus edulis BED1 TaxID=1328754 RepID=A0AAD4BIY8_BOLED|nr:hypothetical protein L210DRAFT_3487780 [Boletus edulis BED1]
MAQSQQLGCAQVTIDTRALVEKILARYPSKFIVFRELLQNSDDAGCDTAEIHFETAAFSSRNPKAAMNADASILPELEATDVTQWTFRNHGKPFTQQDWERLPRIASGNPDPQKVGAFGVGFFSVFSVTERPCVSSGDREMAFWWDDENQLCYWRNDLPKTASRNLWTTFKMPLRKAAPMPQRFSELMQFLASSIVFMVHLKEVTVFFDHHCVGQVKKSLGQSQAVPIPAELGRWSPKKNMFVESVQQYCKSSRHLCLRSDSYTSLAIVLEARIPSYGLHETKHLTVFTANVDVTVGKNLSDELNRSTKKHPPSHLKYSLIYIGKSEYDQSRMDKRNYSCEFPYPFQGLHADLDGLTHAWIYIGHATMETTGIGGHMASHFIPTIERERMDFSDVNVATWNRELLYVGGFLCRVVYELELSMIQRSWEEANAGKSDSRSSRGLQEQFLHVLKFFTFHRSTPESTVPELLANSFYGCSTRPLRLFSSVGVREAPDVRMFHPALAKFLKSLPMLSERVTAQGWRSITALPNKHKVPKITPSDIVQDLRHNTLDAEELVACLQWAISRQDDFTPKMVDLLDAATLRSAGGAICLSSITCFIDPKVLGLHIPPDGPLPLSLVPLGISEHFSRRDLNRIGWEEFTAASWLRYISLPDVMSADERYDFTQSAGWTSRVLSTIRCVWPQISEDIRYEARKIFSQKSCIPTTKGLCRPEHSYLPVADNALLHHLDLPIVSASHNLGFEVDENMKRFLLFIGVRRDPPVQSLLHRMLFSGDWTVFTLIEYLARKRRSLTDEDLSALKSYKFFTREGFQSNGEESTRHRADELYPPVSVFRELRLPVIEWSKESDWNDASPEARLLYDLGLNKFPSLRSVVELCSSREVGVQEAAFMYLCRELHSRYQDYKSENFCDVEFIPAQSNGCVCLKTLGEVYSGTQWEALGFFVVQERYPRVSLRQLGVMQDPPTPKLLDLLEKNPPPDEGTARRWFATLFDHISAFSPPNLIKLSGLPFVPTGPLIAPKFLPPTKCYLDQSPKSALYAKLFVFVEFGTKGNHFLSACGSKNTVSIEDVAEVLIENPEKIFKLAGGYEGFLVELRKIAYQSQEISNETLHKMSREPALLGVCRKKAEGQARWDYEYQFLTSQGVAIVDDTNDYQLFSDCLFIAPQEEVLERFYVSLGCRYMSAVIKEKYHGLHEIPPIKSCREVQTLILERLPLFLQKSTDTKLRVTIPSRPDHLKVKTCKAIHVSKTLLTRNVERTRDVWAIAQRDGDIIEVWISKTAKRDMYEVATSLCRVLFGTNKMNTTLLLEMVLSAKLEVLEQRGFLVDQISQHRRDGCEVGNKTMQKHLASSASTTNSLQPSSVDGNCNVLSGDSEAASHLQSPLHVIDSALMKSCEAPNICDEKSLDVVEHSTLSRTREVIPQSDIRNNVEKAIEACGLGEEKSAIQAGLGESLSSNFCRLSADVGSLRLIGQVKNVQVYVDEGMPDSATFMARMQGPLARFVDIIITLSEMYHISTATLRIFYDVSGGCIAFNCRGTIYLNLRYFEVWHDEQVKSGNRQNAQMSWFLALAHEIAHNVTNLHNSDHEFWFSAICEAHLITLSQLLRPANTRLRYMLWLSLIVNIIFVAYLTKHIASGTNMLF